MKSAWTGYLTEDVFAEVIRLNAEVEETPEAQSKDWHESNKAYAMKQGYLDQMLQFQSRNPETAERFSQIRAAVLSYVNSRLNPTSIG